MTNGSKGCEFPATSPCGKAAGKYLGKFFSVGQQSMASVVNLFNDFFFRFFMFQIESSKFCSGSWRKKRKVAVLSHRLNKIV